MDRCSCLSFSIHRFVSEVDSTGSTMAALRVQQHHGKKRHHLLVGSCVLPPTSALASLLFIASTEAVTELIDALIGKSSWARSISSFNDTVGKEVLFRRRHGHRQFHHQHQKAQKLPQHLPRVRRLGVSCCWSSKSVLMTLPVNSISSWIALALEMKLRISSSSAW